MNVRYLLTHPEWGIYLGVFIGMGCWSKLDPVGQTYACVFQSIEEAAQYSGKMFPGEWKRMEIHPVKCERIHYATLDEIKSAGLEDWDPNQEGSHEAQ